MSKKKRGLLHRLMRWLLRALWRRTKRGAKSWAKRQRHRVHSTLGPREVRRASNEYGGKRKPGPIPERGELHGPPEPPREAPLFLATVGVQHVEFTLHPDTLWEIRDGIDALNQTDDLIVLAQSAAVRLFGSVALTWPVTRIEPRNDAARVVVPDTLYPTTGGTP